MIGGLVEILLFQGVGELASHFVMPLIPGPVIGLVLLLAWFRLRRGVPENVSVVANTLVQHLGLLFVPAAVGVVMFWPQLRSHALAVSAALLVSVVATIAVAAVVMKFLAPDALDPGPPSRRDARDDEAGAAVAPAKAGAQSTASAGAVAPAKAGAQAPKQG